MVLSKKSDDAHVFAKEDNNLLCLSDGKGRTTFGHWGFKVLNGTVRLSEEEFHFSERPSYKPAFPLEYMENE